MLYAVRGSTMVSAVLVAVVGVDLGTYASFSFLFSLLARQTCLRGVREIVDASFSKRKEKGEGGGGEEETITRIATLDV